MTAGDVQAEIVGNTDAEMTSAVAFYRGSRSDKWAVCPLKNQLNRNLLVHVEEA